MKIARLKMVILFYVIVVGSMMGNMITKTHNLPQNGDNFTKTRISFIAPGDSGKNVVWDFSQAQVIDGNTKVFYSVIDDSLINATEYGTLMGEVMNTSSQPYRYGGKELVTLGGLNLSDFGARWLDSPNGTFTTMDPLCEDFQHLSPYLYCAGNPIKYIDPSGMVFTDVAQQYANKLITEAVLKIVGAITNKDVDWNVISEASSTIKEIIILEKSSQVYDVVEDVGLGANYATTRANYRNKRIEIALGDMGVSMDLIAHEFKHLYQFEIGDYSIGPTLSSEPHNLFYDQYDEVEAYSRGAIFGGPEFPTIQSLPAKYSNYHNKKMNATRHPNIKTIIRGPIIKKNNSLQNISKSIKHVFRIHGKTYWPN